MPAGFFIRSVIVYKTAIDIFKLRHLKNINASTDKILSDELEEIKTNV